MIYDWKFYVNLNLKAVLYKLLRFLWAILLNETGSKLHSKL